MHLNFNLFLVSHFILPLLFLLLHLLLLLLILLLLLLFLPVGFPHSSEVVLTNTSEVPMTFRLWVPGEGKEKQGEEQRKPHKHEFTIHPHSGTLPPNMHKKIKVLLLQYLRYYN